MESLKEIWSVYDTKFETLSENVKDNTGKYSKFKVKSLVIPWGKVSRNGVLYNRESFESHKDDWIGAPVMYNHIVEGEILPLGKVDSVYTDNEGLWVILDIDPLEEKIIHKIENNYLSKVSLHVLPEKTIQREGYIEAYFGSPVEISIVPSPGFLEANMTVVKEMFKNYESFKNYIDKKGDKMVEDTKIEGLDIIKELSSLDEKLKITKAKLLKQNEGFRETIEVIDELDSELENTKDKVDEVSKDVEDTEVKLKDVIDVLYALSARFDTLEADIKDIKSKLGEIEKEEEEEKEEREEEKNEENEEENEEDDKKTKLEKLGTKPLFKEAKVNSKLSLKKIF